MDVRSETCKDYYNFYKEICLYSQRRRKAACSDNSERVINANFCLLFNMLTQMLIDIIHQASTYDSHLFENYQKHQKLLNSLRERCYNISLNPLDALSQNAGIAKNIILDTLQKCKQGYERGYLAQILNQRDRVILRCIEHSVHSQLNPVLCFGKINHEKGNKMVLAAKLLGVGSSKKLTSSITGLHYKTLDGIYKNEANNLKGRSGEQATTRLINKLNDPGFTLYVMLMLSIYTICSRVLLLKEPKDNFFDLESLPKEISPHLAIGAFYIGQTLHEKLSKPNTKLKAFNMEFLDSLVEEEFKNCRTTEIQLPKFDEFYELLTLFNKKKARAMACSHCHRPYLYFIGTKGINPSKSIICPACRKQAGIPIR